MRTRIGAMVAAVVVAGAVAPAHAAPPPPIVAATLNVYGAAGNHGQVAPVLRDVLKLVDTQHPDVLGLQEVCRTQFYAVDRELKKRGFVGTMARTRKTHGCGHDRWFGNALYVRAAKYTARARTELPWGQNLRSQVGREPRVLLCESAILRGSSWRVCVTHLAPQNPDRSTQLAKVAATVAPYAKGQLILVGDFNTSVLGPLASWSNGGRGIDRVISTAPTTTRAVLPIPSSDHPAVVATVSRGNQ